VKPTIYLNAFAKLQNFWNFRKCGKNEELFHDKLVAGNGENRKLGLSHEASKQTYWQ
jgi:hypothetical protein